MLKIYNDLKNKKELFEPLIPGKVSMYVCGMTVYDFCHLGHARVMVVFDVVYRYLKKLGYDVTYVRNITDIDDKIIKRANENNEPIKELTKRFTDALNDDTRALNILTPKMEPKATEHIEDIIEMISTLIEKKNAYKVENGDVFFSIESFPNYGALSGKSVGDLKSGIRVDVNESKLDPLDFVLWKSAKDGEPSWNSPWGKGRPGWHIECSAMSTKILGPTFDIHGGGEDLSFPHHENEIAQSECATGKNFVRYWMHNGFVKINNEKMSKSLNNFFTIRDILKSYNAEEVRYFILTSHYRSPLNFSNDHLDNARSGLTRLYLCLRDLDLHNFESEILPEDFKGYEDLFASAMDDDFNTPEALAVLFEIAKEINRLKSDSLPSAIQLGMLLKRIGHSLGILEQEPEAYLRFDKDEESFFSDDEIQTLIFARAKAKESKNWEEADRIRNELLDKGIILEDRGGETVWRRR